VTIFPDPGYKYQAYIFCGVYNTTDPDEININNNAIRFGSVATNFVNPQGSQRVKVSFDTTLGLENDLILQNTSGSSNVLCWTVQVNRIR
jgi:hypothetical protein